MTCRILGRRTARLLRIAGLRETRLYRSITASMSNWKRRSTFLKAGNYLNVDIFALKKASDEKMIAPLGSVPFSLEPNDMVEALVVIQNKNIGHSLIPEVRDLYEAWVEFTVQDSAGKDIYHSGFLKPDGLLDARAHSFTNRPVNIEGRVCRQPQSVDDPFGCL